MSPREKLNSLCVEAWLKLMQEEEIYGIDSVRAKKYRAVWWAYDNSFKVVYGEGVVYAGY